MAAEEAETDKCIRQFVMNAAEIVRYRFSPTAVNRYCVPVVLKRARDQGVLNREDRALAEDHLKTGEAVAVIIKAKTR